MSPKTRRDFLQLSGSVVAVATLAKSSPLWSQVVASPRPVKTWITSDTQKVAPVDAPKWTAASEDRERSHRSHNLLPGNSWLRWGLYRRFLLPVLPVECSGS